MRNLRNFLLSAGCGGILLIPVTASSMQHAPKELPLLPYSVTPAAAAAASPLQPPIVLAQGNAGGTIGKRSRTVSGAEPTARPAAVKTRSLGTTKRSYRRSTPRASRTAVRSRGNCISGTIAGYSGRVCY
jgi:hypothetical protein